jgi:DUF4097 and DUF4098 domain-containing protein YvlB
MKRVCFGVLLVLFAAGAAAADTEQFDRTISFHSGGRLKLNNFSGRVTITGTDGGNVVVHALRHATRERLDAIHIDIAVDASEVSIEANKKDSSWRDREDNVVETDFDIQVPRQTELDVHVFSSDVRISGVSGRQDLKTFSGALTVADATGPMHAETFSGKIDVTFAGAVNGQVDFRTFSGRLSSARPVSVHTASRRGSMSGELGSGGDMQLQFKTFSGDVTLR